MAKKLEGKKRASGPHHGRGQPVAKRLSTPNPRYQQPSPEPAAPAPPPPQEKQPPPVSLRPKKLTLLDLKHCGPCAKEHDWVLFLRRLELNCLVTVEERKKTSKMLLPKGTFLNNFPILTVFTTYFNTYSDTEVSTHSTKKKIHT